MRGSSRNTCRPGRRFANENLPVESVVTTWPSSVQMSMPARPPSLGRCTPVPSRSIHTFPIAALVSIGQARRTCTHATACGETGCRAPARALAIARTSTMVPDAEASATA